MARVPAHQPPRRQQRRVRSLLLTLLALLVVMRGVLLDCRPQLLLCGAPHRDHQVRDVQAPARADAAHHGGGRVAPGDHPERHGAVEPSAGSVESRGALRTIREHRSARPGQGRSLRGLRGHASRDRARGSSGYAAGLRGATPRLEADLLPTDARTVGGRVLVPVLRHLLN